MTTISERAAQVLSLEGKIAVVIGPTWLSTVGDWPETSALRADVSPS